MIGKGKRKENRNEHDRRGGTKRRGETKRRTGTAAFCLALILSVSIPVQAGFTPLQDEMGIRYVNEAGKTMAQGWQEYGGKWYFTGADGYAQTGWLEQDGNWYFLNSTGEMATGWNQVEGKYYYFKEDGSMAFGNRKEEETLYTFSPKESGAFGSLAYARRVKNSGGGAFPIGFYDEKRQALADNINELKGDYFDGDEEDDYYEDDKTNYDKDASFIISGRLTEIAEHRLELARTKGYGNGNIPDEGTLSDYLKAINYNSGRRSMEVYLKNCDGADEAEAKLLRSHGEEEKKRSDRAVYYKEMGIAHQEVNGKDYYMVIFMR